MKKIMLGIAIFLVAIFSLHNLVQATEDSYKPVEKSQNIHPAFIDNIDSKNGKTYLTADYIEWYEGEEANVKFRERENDPEVTKAPDGYYIINDNPKLRSLEVSEDAVVLMQYYDRTGTNEVQDISWNEQIPLAKFLSIFKQQSGLKNYPYHLTVKDGKIVKIVQQYIP
jgi:hypothetical protein